MAKRTTDRVRSGRVVIGAGWGDEGKGATVDRLSGPETTVVRFNGGAQAGHTVAAPDAGGGTLVHVFHHVGSGALRGAATFLSRHTVASPMHLLPELDALRALGVRPRLAADRRAALATPYDMLVNQGVERARGDGRHGSCGYGIGEAVERAGSPFATTLADLADPAALRRRLRAIRAEWVPARLAALGLARLPAAEARLVADDRLLDAFVEAAGLFAAAVRIERDASCLEGADLVFEGAQGLALDQERGDFPHVTRSFTGLRNVVDVAAEIGLDALDVTYVTRCYATRHGAGPLPRERTTPPVPRFRDPTNRPNPWQGTLRFAALDADALAGRIAADLGDAARLDVEATLTVTCLDQAGPTLPLWIDGAERAVATEALPPLLLERLGFARGSAAYGPGRDAVRRIEARPVTASSGRAACRPPSGPSPTPHPRRVPASSCGRRAP